MVFWMVLKLVNVPPSQRIVTYGIPHRTAAFLTSSLACRFVPMNRIVPPRLARPFTKSKAIRNFSNVFTKLMTWFLLRVEKKKGFILGFHREEKCQKGTPAVSNSSIVG